MTPTDTLRETVARKIGQYTYAHLLPETSDCEEWDQMDDADRMIYRIAADAALSAIEAAGWRVVPVEPTEEMLATQDKAHVNAPTLKGQLNDFCRTFASEIWAELLSAAPRLDATVRGEEGCVGCQFAALDREGK